MILYLDTSALVKRYVSEPGSKEVNALIEQANAVGSIMDRKSKYYKRLQEVQTKIGLILIAEFNLSKYF